MPQAPDFDYEEAVQACACGDAEALRALYERESRWLLGVALRIVRDREAARDVLQEAFLQIWQRAGTYQRALGSARGWIYTVVRHGALDAARRAAREMPAGDLHDSLGEQAAAALDVYALAAGTDGAALARGLATLDERTRGCIVDAFVLGLTHQQIALRRAAPLGTVKSSIRRGLLSLRAFLS